MSKKQKPEPWKKIYRSGLSSSDFTADFMSHRKESKKRSSGGFFRKIAAKLGIVKKKE